MKKNIGRTGRIARSILAIGLFAFAFWQSSWIALIAALFVLFEVASSWCIFNAITGRNSCPIDK